jgi:hypothetical protein
VLAALLAATPAAGRTVLILDYDAFGPQALADPILGRRWPPWEAGCHCERPDAPPPTVVVYADLPLERVRRMIAADPARGHDVRYVERGAAFAFLENALRDLAGYPDLSAVASTLAATRAAVVDRLGRPPTAPP